MLLDADADPRIPSNVVGTAIHEAAFSGNNEALTMLLDRGASPNAEWEHDRQLTFKLATPLQCAAWECNFDGIDVLLTRGAHINAVHNGDMGTALHAAAAAAHPKVTIHLLDRGADFRIRAGRCGSVLAAAGYGGNHEVVLILLEKGATLDDFEDMKSSRSWHELDETARQALSKSIISHSKDAFCPSLIEAAKVGAINAAQRFLNEGEHKERKVFATGRTALAYAAQNGHAEIVKLLLENGSQIDNGDRWGNTPLHLAIFSGHLEIVKILVTHNTNVNCQNSFSETPLFIAKTRGRGEIVKYLESHSLH
jgi:ankyrin repeat protein